MVRFGLFGVAALAASLATAAEAANWAEEDAKIAACFTAMDRDPALVSVNAKFARRDPTQAQLADESRPSADEAAGLRLRAEKTRPCRELRLAAVRAYWRSLEPAYATLYYQADQVFDYLQAGAIAYGTANALAAEALELFQAREKVYFAADAGERAALAEVWAEQLHAAHSNPPPDGPRACVWDELNILCE